MDKTELYKIAVGTRQFEIQLFWQRSNYFLVLNTAFAVGFLSAHRSLIAWIFPVLGVAVSLLWFRVNLGGKFWQSRWEEAAARIERELCPDANLFAASADQIRTEVEKSLAVNIHSGFHKWLDKQILKKPSVSYYMTLLSCLFIFAWAAAFITVFVR